MGMMHVPISTIGTGSQAVFTAFMALLCVALPCLIAAGLLVLWWVPLRPREQQFLYDVVRHAHAWSSIEVLWLVVSNFASQVNMISVWIVEDTAKDLCDKVADLTGEDGCY